MSRALPLLHVPQGPGSGDACPCTAWHTALPNGTLTQGSSPPFPPLSDQPPSSHPLRRLLVAQCAPSHKHHRKAVLENPLPRAHLRDPSSLLLALLGPSARLLHPCLHQDIARPLASPPPAGTGLLSTKEGRECSFSAPCALPGAWERCLPARSSFRLGVLLPPALEAAGAQRLVTAVPATRRPPAAPRHKGWPG